MNIDNSETLFNTGMLVRLVPTTINPLTVQFILVPSISANNRDKFFDFILIKG